MSMECCLHVVGIKIRTEFLDCPTMNRKCIKSTKLLKAALDQACMGG